MTQAQALQPYPQARSAETDTGSLRQSLLHFGQGQARAAAAAPTPTAAPRPALPGWPDHGVAAGASLLFRPQLLGPNLFAVPPADPKLRNCSSPRRTTARWDLVRRLFTLAPIDEIPTPVEPRRPFFGRVRKSLVIDVREHVITALPGGFVAGQPPIPGISG